MIAVLLVLATTAARPRPPRSSRTRARWRRSNAPRPSPPARARPTSPPRLGPAERLAARIPGMTSHPPDPGSAFRRLGADELYQALAGATPPADRRRPSPGRLRVAAAAASGRGSAACSTPSRSRSRTSRATGRWSPIASARERRRARASRSGCCKRAIATSACWSAGSRPGSTPATRPSPATTSSTRAASSWKAFEDRPVALASALPLTPDTAFLPRLAGHSFLMGHSLPLRRNMVSMFVDMVDSTGLIFSRTPEQVLGLIQTFMEVVVEIGAHHCGDVKDFEGDGAFLYFEGPGEAMPAAFRLRERLRRASPRGARAAAPAHLARPRPRGDRHRRHALPPDGRDRRDPA